MSSREEPRPWSSSYLDQDALREMVECNPHKSTWELALDLNISQSTIYCRLKKIGKVSKLSVWIPHILREKNKKDCISIVTNLLFRQKNDLFLNNIITADEKWVLNDSVRWKKQLIYKDESPQHTPKGRA